ncbi:6-bladed beta-propeller [Algoriphagus halophilus]|uniref:6-bladed beta-propeller protein n=1 Tax=Algoriphagus halophilus TaxID=226505 RepID=A0A1N6HUL9_9BACT|nr:6-bladed beta-propeller [Algoriphagus halophilus]SIO23492.1 6-bladed beta-propeller protein [Algoriphagus halophilus]
MKTIIFILNILLLFSSCLSKESRKEIRLAKVNKPLNLATYFSKMKAIPLDSSVTVGQVDKVIIAQDKIILSDFNIMKSLRVFDLNGKQLAYRDDIGEGPLGMSEISDFCIYEQKIYVLNGARKHIYTFDLELNQLEDIDLAYSAGSLKVTNEGILTYHQNFSEDNINSFNQYDLQGNLIQGFYPINSELDKPYVGNEEFLVRGNELIHYHPFVDSLIILSNLAIKASYFLDFEDQFYPLSEYTSISHPLDRLKKFNEFKGYKNINHGIGLPDNKYLFSIIHDHTHKFLLINLTTHNMMLYEKLKNDFLTLPSQIKFMGNDENQAWFTIDPVILDQFYRINYDKINEEDMLINPGIEHNPIIFIAEFKNP